MASVSRNAPVRPWNGVTNFCEHFIRVIIIAEKYRDIGVVSRALFAELANLAVHGIHGEELIV